MGRFTAEEARRATKENLPDRLEKIYAEIKLKANKGTRLHMVWGELSPSNKEALQEDGFSINEKIDRRAQSISYEIRW